MVILRGLAGTLGELFQFLLERKLWWMIPMVVLLLVFSALIILGSTAGIGPFIYTLF
ncbi:MAG: DUF5989 family protein [Armatimonadota bacterium]